MINTEGDITPTINLGFRGNKLLGMPVNLHLVSINGTSGYAVLKSIIQDNRVTASTPIIYTPVFANTLSTKIYLAEINTLGNITSHVIGASAGNPSEVWISTFVNINNISGYNLPPL